MINYGVLVASSIIPVEKSTPGSLPVVETAPPEALAPGTKAVAHYEQQDDQIVKIWEVLPWTEEERRAMEAREAEATTEDAAQQTNL